MKHPLRHPLGFAALTGTLALVAATSVVAGAGCTVTTESGAEDAGVFDGGHETSADTCNACVADQCLAAWALCLTDESCLAVRASATGASSDTGRACDLTSDGGANGGDLYRAFAMCNDARTCAGGCASDCASRCTSPTATTPAPCDVASSAADASSDVDTDAAVEAGAEDAGDAGASTAPSTDRCASCADGKCDSAKKACAIGSECAAFLECAFACTSAACVTECGSSHATGKVAAVELATCAQAGCEAECGL